MATEFIGSIVTVTLIQPHDAQVRGLVQGIAEGQRLDLKNGICLHFVSHFSLLTVTDP